MNTPTGIAALVAAVGDFVTGAITWMGQFVTAITGSDLLILAVVCIPLVGLGAGLVKRLVSIRA